MDFSWLYGYVRHFLLLWDIESKSRIVEYWQIIVWIPLAPARSQKSKAKLLDWMNKLQADDRSCRPRLFAFTSVQHHSQESEQEQEQERLNLKVIQLKNPINPIAIIYVCFSVPWWRLGRISDPFRREFAQSNLRRRILFVHAVIPPEKTGLYWKLIIWQFSTKGD